MKIMKTWLSRKTLAILPLLFTSCTSSYYVKWYGDIDSRNICGDDRKCIAGGGNLPFTNFSNRSSNPPPYEGDAKSYLGRIYNLKSFSDSSRCYSPDKLDIFKVSSSTIEAEISERGRIDISASLQANLSQYLNELTRKAGLDKAEMKAKIDLVVKSTSLRLHIVKGNIVYEEYALKQASLDSIKADAVCQNILFSGERIGKKVAILSHIAIITTDANWKDELAKEILASLKVELGADIEKILKASAGFSPEAEKSFQRAIAGVADRSAVIFSVAYTPLS